MEELNVVEKNVVEKIVTDEPALPVYIPYAGYTDPGIASFNNDDFYVGAEGKVSLSPKLAHVEEAAEAAQEAAEIATEKAQIAQDAAESAQQSAEVAEKSAEIAQEAASDLSSYANRTLLFVEKLPVIGSEDYLYAVVSDAGSNLFDLWIWTDEGYKLLGGANLVSSEMAVSTIILPVHNWQNNVQTVLIPNLTTSKQVEISPVDSSASAYVESNIDAIILDGGLQFSCEIVPTKNITVKVIVYTQADIPNLSGYYTESEINSLAGHTLLMTMDQETYVLTFKLISVDGTTLSETSVDLPIESMVIGIEYDEDTKSIILTLQNGNTINVPINDIFNGLATQDALDDVINGTTPVAKAEESNKVANVLTITKDGQPYKEYDGSEAVDIDISAGTSQIVKTQATLTTSNWIDNRQDVSIEGITTNSTISVYPADISAAQYILCDVKVSQANGRLIFTCNSVPTINLHVIVEIL